MSHSKLCGSKYLSPNKNIICGIIYRQDNTPEVCQTYFEETVEKFALNNNTLYRMGDFNVDLLKCETSHFSHNFLLHLQSCYLIATVDKPTRVHRASATLIDNIFVNNPDKILASGYIVTDISDHFSRVCVMKSAIDKYKSKSIKLRDYSKVSAVRLSDGLSNVHRDDILSSGKNNVDVLFPSFHNKFNAMVKKKCSHEKNI